MQIADDLPCQDFVELTTAYLERALPTALRESFEAHVELCPGCRLYLEQVRLTVRALRQPPSEGLPNPIKEALLRIFRG